MPPKTATLLLAQLLFLILTPLLLSSATAHNGCGADSVPLLLGYYDLPLGFFPKNVKDFSCEEGTGNNLRLKIELEGSCSVTSYLAVQGYKLIFDQEITVDVSKHTLTEINGVSINLEGGEFKGTYNLDAVNAFSLYPETHMLQVVSTGVQDHSTLNMVLPIYSLRPPPCDDKYSSSGAVVDKDHRNFPKWVYKSGRLLPVVVAA